MELLVDTHTALWWFDDPSKLSDDARTAISDPANAVYLSAAVAWEIAIKKGLGKLEAPDDLESVMTDSQMQSLSISVADATAVGLLPLHHRDPFDRMLVAQAIERDWTLVSRDPMIQKYPVRILLA